MPVTRVRGPIRLIEGLVSFYCPIQRVLNSNHQAGDEGLLPLLLIQAIHLEQFGPQLD